MDSHSQGATESLRFIENGARYGRFGHSPLAVCRRNPLLMKRQHSIFPDTLISGQAPVFEGVHRKWD